jgi:EAL domain-containing protein (putative c-di-GMP-specific phosphodiesterase class I)
MRFVGDVPPAGLARDYMRWIARTAVRQLSRWTDAGVPVGRVSINVWPSSVGSDLVDDVLAEATAERVEPSRVEIESQPDAIYDTATMNSLRELREAGLRVALDDFGEGDVRFSWLRDAPFDVVKLPVMFVTRSGQAFDDAVIASGVAFARSIRAETVAEGVESVAIRDRVRALGCDIGQGYLWSRQVVGDELPGVVAAIGIDGART